MSYASLAEALAKVQIELPTIVKNKTAKVKGTTRNGDRFEYEYKYADYADVAGKIMPILGKHGLSFTSLPTSYADLGFGLLYRLLHSSGELLEGFYPIDTSNMSLQQVGGAITYARRYCLSAITGVAAEEDTDAQGAEHASRDARDERSAMGRALAAQRDSGSPYGPSEGAEEPPPGPPRDPEIQKLADLAFKVLADGAGTVERLQELCYEPARAHRGWLGSMVAHPGSGEIVALSAVIREAKSELEKRL